MHARIPAVLAALTFGGLVATEVSRVMSGQLPHGFTWAAAFPIAAVLIPLWAGAAVGLFLRHPIARVVFPWVGACAAMMHALVLRVGRVDVGFAFLALGILAAVAVGFATSHVPAPRVRTSAA